jgi:DNA replication protein DnaC
MAECDDRDSRRAVRRMNAAGFPRDKRVDEFDFDANPNVPAATVHQLAGCGWVKAGQPLCLIGDSGTGKTHLLIALGTAAAQVGHSVRYVLASKLFNELVEAADDKQLSKTIARYGRVDLLICDELGYLELDRRGAELLFQVLTEREESPPSRSRPTSRSPAGPRPSLTHDSAPLSSTGSPSTARSSKPAPPATGSRTHVDNRGQSNRPDLGRVS